MYAQNNAESQTDFQASRSSGYFELTTQSISQSVNQSINMELRKIVFFYRMLLQKKNSKKLSIIPIKSYQIYHVLSTGPIAYVYNYAGSHRPEVKLFS